MSAALDIMNLPPGAANDNAPLSAPAKINLRRAARPEIDSPDRFRRRIYDGNLKRVRAQVDGQTIFNVYDASGQLVFVKKPGGITTEYVPGPNGVFARMVASGSFIFMHNDHLGSASVAANKNGGHFWRETYAPYGETLLSPAANDNHPGFTTAPAGAFSIYNRSPGSIIWLRQPPPKHIKDKATGLNYMQARYYDPVIGRFLSVDPVGFVGSGGNPGYFNRYAYTMNDPVNMIDPDGMQVSHYPPTALAQVAVNDAQKGTNHSSQATKLALTLQGTAAATALSISGGIYAYNALGPVAFAEGLAGLVPGMEGATLTGSLGTGATLTASRSGLIDEIAFRVTSQFDNFKCMECSDALVSALKQNNYSGEIINLSTSSANRINGHIWSDTAGKLISTNGKHKAIMVDGKVYDNIHKKGISFEDWKADFHTPLNDLSIEVTDF